MEHLLAGRYQAVWGFTVKQEWVVKGGLGPSGLNDAAIEDCITFGFFLLNLFTEIFMHNLRYLNIFLNYLKKSETEC